MKTNIKWKLVTYASLLLTVSSPASSTALAINTTNDLTASSNSNKKAVKHTQSNKKVSTKHITPTIDWNDWQQTYHSSFDTGVNLHVAKSHFDGHYSDGDDITFIDNSTNFSTIADLQLDSLSFTFNYKSAKDPVVVMSDLVLVPKDGNLATITIPQSSITVGGKNSWGTANTVATAYLSNNVVKLDQEYDINFKVNPGYSQNTGEVSEKLNGQWIETQMTKVMYLNATTGKEVAPSTYLGRNLGAGAPVTATATDLSAQGYDYTSEASLITDSDSTEVSGDTVDTTLKSGKVGNPKTSTGKQVVVFWYNAQPKVNAKDSTIYVGDSWKPEDNFDSATDNSGSDLTYDQFIAAGGTVDSSKVDTTKVGDYPVTYSLNGITGTSTVHVLENKQSIDGSDVTKHVGDAVPDDSEFNATATGKDGADIGVTLDKSKVDMSKVGDYDVVITADDGQTKTVKVHVLADQRSVNGSDVTKYTGDAMPDDSEFNATATDIDGNPEGVTLDKSQVDMSTPGDYDVVITSDSGLTKTVQVHVLANQQSITGSDVTKYVGDTMPDDSEFKASATDKDGKDIGVKLDKSKVDMTKIGDYDVLITADDGQTKSVQVHVLANQQSIDSSDVTKHVGDAIPDDAEFKASAIGKDGQPVNVTLDKSKVDMSTAGDYDVLITSEDGQLKTVKVHVLPDLCTINGSDVTRYAGDAMPADGDFNVSATDIDGNTIAVTVDKSKVDMTKPGDYDVLLTALDGQTKTVQVHVLPNQQSITGSDVTKHVGEAMPDDSEFKASATDIDGKNETVILDKSAVDMSKIGDYDVVITAKDGQTKTVQVHVREKVRIPEDSTVIVKYVDEDGNVIAKDDILMGQAGDKYTTKAKTVDGYTLIEEPANKDGVFVKGTQTLVYKYAKEEAEAPLKPADPSKDYKEQPKNQIKHSDKKLPQTGESSLEVSMISIAGVVTLLSAVYLVLGGKRKSENNG